MSYRLFIILIVGAILQCMYDIFITNRISKREAKKAHYDCSKCQNWRCYYKYCEKEKSVFNK